ncbi:hypothetical protein SELSPUOL_01059 [Selenomonas sputigena ATCC 35185]|uniref:Uncharacterized protein n=1 Tax=Selenomonas sputigena (strain ATCC 35185 / DSM 20758 / CCUG 44933 / VPI D19B-28) TaxID=546271 RepID=C9LTP8_SELS3|nr:hypothetical protein SELSPUOL_01059 [Selenomonas sputigena ATCC 35185]
MFPLTSRFSCYRIEGKLLRASMNPYHLERDGEKCGSIMVCW